MKIRVGDARPEDIFKIEKILEEGREEMSTPLPVTERIFAHQELLKLIGMGFVWVARRATDDAVVGVIIARPERLWFRSQVHYIQSLEFYVVPEHRKGATASKLLERAKRTADNVGRPLVMTLTSGYRAEMKDRFVEREGFDYMGGNLIYTPQEASPEPEEEV